MEMFWRKQELTMPERLNRFPYREGWLWLLSLVAVLALFGTVLLFIRDAEQNRQREQDRIAFDRGSCERGNLNRRINRDIAMAGARLDQRIIELLVSRSPRVNQEEINRLLAPAFEEYQEAVDKIELVDCAGLLKATNGEGGR